MRLAQEWKPPRRFSQGEAMRGQDQGWDTLPLSGDEKRPLPVAWRAIHRAKDARGT